MVSRRVIVGLCLGTFCALANGANILKRTPAKDYPPGFFTALMRRDNFPPFFESVLHHSRADYKRQMASAAGRATAISTGTGWNTGTLSLPGTPKYLAPGKMVRSA